MEVEAEAEAAVEMDEEEKHAGSSSEHRAIPPKAVPCLRGSVAQANLIAEPQWIAYGHGQAVNIWVTGIKMCPRLRQLYLAHDQHGEGNFLLPNTVFM